MPETASDMEYLRWFHDNADFGPSDEDVRMILQDEFEKQTGKRVPRRYKESAVDR